MSEARPALHERWSLRLRVFLFFAFIALGSAAFIIVAGFVASVRSGIAPSDLVLGGLIALFGVTGLCVLVWLKFDENVAQPIETIAGEIRAMVHGDGRWSAAPQTGRYLGALAPTAAAIGDVLTRTRRETDAAIERATVEAERQRRRLETVLRDLQEGIVICSRDHRVLLYNRRAHDILHVAGELGLGRSLARLVDARALAHALERLENRFASGRHKIHRDGLTLPTILTTQGGHRRLRSRIALHLDTSGEKAVGYVVAFDDATDVLAAGLWRDRLIDDVTRDMRQRIGALSLAGEVLACDEALSPETRATLRAAIATETAALSERLDRLDQAAEDILAGAWPMADLFSPTLLGLVRDRSSEARHLTIEIGGDPVWLTGDSASLVDLLDRLVNRIAVFAGVDDLRLATRRNGERAVVLLRWSGRPVPLDALKLWLEERLADDLGSVSGVDVLARHKTDVWSRAIDDGAAELVMPLALSAAYYARPEKSGQPLPERPEFYDFGLLERGGSTALDDMPLTALTFVVFDTETTGLEPGRGDEIVSIAGARIVNGRLLRGEVFDSFVNPGRKIPAASTKVHGITDDMVRDADPPGVVLARFHGFVGDAVLVAHNAAFDMKFLSMGERAANVRFDRPVLDTVLLAAHLFGTQESLTLDRLVERFGIVLREEDRHTALGDALATAQVFLRLVALLEAVGVRTLGEARAAAEGQVAIRRAQKAY